ncbi:MAG: hypothetical protein ABIZ91_18640, partial [Gemmatimonadaceae bacterium]
RGADSILRAAGALMATGPDPEVAFFHAVISKDHPAGRAALARLALEAPSTITNAVHRLTAYARDPAMADTVLQRAFRAGFATADARGAHYLAVVIAATQGQLVRALREADAVAESNPGEALELRALLLTTPASSHLVRERASVLRRLQSDNRHSGAHTDLTSASGLGRLTRWYLLGLFAAQAWDTLAAIHFADSLTSAKPTTSGSNVATVFSAGLRAHVLSLKGQPEAALATLAAAPEPNQGVHGQLVASQLNERLLRGRLLEGLDRSEEALDVYGSLVFGDANSFLLAAPAALHRARLLVRLGRSPEAKADYATFLRTWARADPALQPVVDSARREMARVR